jgi:DNA adenine methylase
MALTNLEKTPWPWFGGKSDAAPAVWAALEDVHHYVEPFAGSLAVLLRRPHLANRPYHSETVNDIDGLLVNAWRAMRADPRGMAEAASWPVSEADLTARHLALVAWKESGALERLMADPEWHDTRMAGWWVWGQSCWIGSGWCSGQGPWVVGADGRIEKRPRAGRIQRKLPQLTVDGRGTVRPQLREPGVARQLPHVVSNGQGVNHPSGREPGVADAEVAEVDEHTEFHPMTMPELVRWFEFLSARLRHVRILNGDWTRCLTDSAARTLSVRKSSGGFCGVFFDPPYGDVRTAGVYTHDSMTISTQVRQWCIEHGEDPSFRVVLAGYDTEHVELEQHGWACVPWYRAGFLKGGMRNTGSSGTQNTRERLWLSPNCVLPEGVSRSFTAEAKPRLTSADRVAALLNRRKRQPG